MNNVINKQKCIQNFYKTIQINETCHALKKAYLAKMHPALTDIELERKIANEAVKRKEEEWLTVMN